MCVHADSLFTSLGKSACAECMASIEVYTTTSVKNCMFENAITTQGPPYIRSLGVTAVRLEGNTSDPKPKMFEVEDPGTLSAANYLL
jgi:hypothetical protein